MRYTVLSVLIAICLGAGAQQADSAAAFNVQKNKGLYTLQILSGIPLQYTLVSCTVFQASKGDVYKKYCNMNDIPAANEFYYRFMDRDVISMEEIIVSVDGKRMRWPAKTISFTYTYQLLAYNYATLLKASAVDSTVGK